MANKRYFEVVPVFNQAENPQVWRDFAALEIKCRKDVYHYEIEDNYFTDTINSHRMNWENSLYSFAFVSYDAGKMVGFANGNLEQDTGFIYLHNLYVDPDEKYKRQGLGKRLLDNVEKTAKLVSSNIKVVPLNDVAAAFFKHQGYTNYSGRILCKKLDKPAVGVTPVFQWIKPKMRVKFTVNMPCNIFKQNVHKPVFLYINKDVEGIALQTNDKDLEMVVDSKHGATMEQFYKLMLIKSLEKAK